MTKTLKKIIVGSISAIAILLAGLFFASCGYDTSKVNVSASTYSLTLELGGMNESQNVTFTINDAPDGFAKKLRFNVDNEGVASISNPTYNGNEVTVTITAKQGGSCNIMAITEEGYKYTNVQVNVIQHSETLTFDESSLYLSNSTPFVANNGYYYFDSNTTDKNMSFYYVDVGANDTFNRIEGEELVFTSTSGTNIRFGIGKEAFKFDKVYIDEEGESIVFSLDGVPVYQTESVLSQFNFLAFYDYSMNYTTQLGIVNTVNVYQDLKVEFEGGYLTSTVEDGNIIYNDVEFKEIEGNNINIVPNSDNYSSSIYILKVRILNYSDLIEYDFTSTNAENIVVDYYNYDDEDEEGNVFYLKIFQNYFDNVSSTFTVNVKYKGIDDDILDDSVNLRENFDINVLVAPKELLFNGRSASEYSSQENPVTLYNRYRFPEFGWQQLQISVSAGVDAEPVYSYVYVEYNTEAQDLEIRHNNVTLTSDRHIEDLSSPFSFRGVLGASKTEHPQYFTVYLVCEDIFDANGNQYVLSQRVYYEIVEGATSIERNGNMGDGTTLYLDFEDTMNEPLNISNYLFANAYFQSITFEFLSGVNVVNFEVPDNCCVTSSTGEDFYLNFGVTSRQIGTGVYNVVLDNGTTTTITFTVIETMKAENTSIEIEDFGNIGYYEKAKSSDEVLYDDVLYLELLNPTSVIEGEYVIQFGELSTIVFSGNIQNVTANENANAGWNEGVVSYLKIGNSYQFETRTNGQTSLSFIVSGYVVNDVSFTRETENFVFTVNIISYSLLSEFTYLNDGKYAVDNVVYYGDSSYIPEEDKELNFSIRAQNTNSYNFYQYYITNELATALSQFAVDNRNDQSGELSYMVSSADFENLLTTQLVQENYDNKFVYYYVVNNYDEKASTTSTIVTMTFGAIDVNVYLVFENGFMFYSKDNILVEDILADNGQTYDVQITFSNIFTIDNPQQIFNLETLTYTHENNSSTSLTLHAYVRQRNYSQMRYDLNIVAERYTPVEDISTSSVIEELVFTNSKLVETFMVYVSPQDATNSTLKAEFVQDNFSSANLVECTITQQITGTYLVEVSAESFYENTSNIDDISDVSLSGMLYIYPIEWGRSAAVISGHEIIEIKISYRNGSEKNRYILEDVDDVLAIGSNEKSLASHYEIRNTIDLSGVSFKSMGLFDDNGNLIEGFKGSIVGTTAQAGISGVNLITTTGENINGVLPSSDNVSEYFGLFAKLEEGAYLKNITIQGSMSNLSFVSLSSYVGLVAGQNYGKISNVSVNLSSNSSINSFTIGNSVAYVGTVTGYNYGEIKQFYKAYNTEKYIDLTENNNIISYTIDDVEGEFGYGNMTVKNMTYYDSRFTIYNVSGSVYVGGVAGATSGNILREDDETLNIYGYSNYTAFVDILIEDTQNKNATVYVGGVVGLAKSLPSSTDNILEIDNLIVGGEIDNQYNADDINSNVTGGIVGFGAIASPDESTMISQNMSITNNIARTFLRGQKYTGAIIGFDDYDTYQLDNTADISYSNNRVEAVDDGRVAYDASMFILRVVEGKISDNNNDGISEFQNNSYYNDTIYAVGNAVDSGKSLFTTLNDEKMFNSLSYVTREQTANENYSTLEVSRNFYYGDFLTLNNGVIVDKVIFEKQPVNIGLSKDDFKLLSQTGDGYVYLSYYFNVESLISSQNETIIPQNIVDELNIFTTNSDLYPFQVSTRDAEIVSTSSGIVSVDPNGSITTLNEGLASIRLQSILNVQSTIDIYLYVVNFFNKDVENSVFYTSNTPNAQNLVDNTQINVYGSKQTSIYAVASYDYEHKVGDDVEWSVSKDGILRYKGISFQLQENTSLKVDVKSQNGTNEGDYTQSFVNGQEIVFVGKKNANGEGSDVYTLSSYIETEVLGEKYTMAIGGKNNDNDISLTVNFKETATKIQTSSNMISMQTNDTFKEKLKITSKNKEFAYYEIYMLDENGEILKLVQQRMDTSFVETALEEDKLNEWYQYINTYSVEDDLFILTFEDITSVNALDGKIANNENLFNMSLSVNRYSDAYQNKSTTNIYGTYKIVFYANELYNGVTWDYIFNLSEAKITNVVVDNYSSIKDISIADQVIVPSQYGILEISVDPIDAEFDTFTISNNAINNNEGAGIVAFTFVYQTSENNIINFVADSEFGTYSNGVFTFTYDEMMSYFESLINYNENLKVRYNGKIFIRYLLSSSGVEDSVPIGFDIKLQYLDDGVKEFQTSVMLTTKLANYAKLTFDNRDESDVYYVARGLNYGMTLDYYGFGLNDIQISVSNASIATITGSSTSYTLNVTSNEITYTGDVGYRLVINVYASRVVDNVTVEYSQEIVVYVMEYVFNYQYVEGVNEDLVRGMENGVISTAIGNAYTLEFDIWDFMEYDSTNQEVVENVQTFINNLTNNVTFEVVDNSTGNRDYLENGKEIRSNYFIINGFVFTAIRLYQPQQDIYYFIVDGSYAMNNGVYISDPNSDFEQRSLHTLFSFSIHEQSTEESPLPVETYEDFLAMEDGEYYILLNNITLPNEDSLEYEQFESIEARVAGFDGNGYSIMIGGDYHFDPTITSFGVFNTISDSTSSNVVFKNVTVEIFSNTNFIMDANTFSIGLLANTNNGIITNCRVIATNNSALSVTYTTSSSGSYVAGLVANNNGIITNSTTSIDILTNVNLSGFVATNTGTISSSAFRGGSLKNETTLSTEYTAGFVLQNSGNIYTSLVSGVEEDELNPNEVYYKGTTDFIHSYNNIAGFVYQNTGFVKDCYTNINMENAGMFASGFVFINDDEGEIRSSFSTSVLTSYNTQSYGFARASTGEIWDCYYLSQNKGEFELNNVNGVINRKVKINVEEDVNVSISTIDENPTQHNLKSLALKDFVICAESDFESTFVNFTHTNTRNHNSVWFYNNTNQSETFNSKVFNLYRLELVAPNITAFSQRYLYSTEEIVDPESGVVTVQYNYLNTPNAGVTGSVYNPILLHDADTFENYILNENDRNNYNFGYYRVINNIDYSEFEGNSQLYTTRFMGYMEGNFLSISNIRMVSSSSLVYAGLFAEVGSSSRVDAVGTLLNFDFEPSELVFTNAQVAGSIAGRFDSGTIANVNVLCEIDIMITGRNIVGGVVGLAIGNYNISNVQSEMSARATYIALEDNEFDKASTIYQYYSFAGGIVGVASGSGILNQMEVNAGIGVVGAKAGGLVGFIDENVSVTELSLNVDDNFMINAYRYGGLVAGESSGNIDGVEVVGNELNVNLFYKLPYTPLAVGGFAGKVSGGSISNISMSQNIVISTETSTSGVEYLGGVAGEVVGNVQVTNAYINATLTGFSVVGGYFGKFSGDYMSLILNNINFVGNINILATSISSVYAGGVIGVMEDSTNVKITTELDASVVDALQVAKENSESYQSFVGTDKFDSLSTDFALEKDGTLLKEYQNSANNIIVDSIITIYCFDETTNIFFGEIVADSESQNIDISNTIASSNLNASILDMVLTTRVPLVSTLTNLRDEYTYDNQVDEEPVTAYGFTRTLTGKNLNFSLLETNGYTKGEFAYDFTANIMPTIYSQNITFNYYESINSGAYLLNVNSFGVGVDDVFLGFGDEQS